MFSWGKCFRRGSEVRIVRWHPPYGLSGSPWIQRPVSRHWSSGGRDQKYTHSSIHIRVRPTHLFFYLLIIFNYGRPTIKRIVVTSSVASIVNPTDVPFTFSENDWNTYSVQFVEKDGAKAAGVHIYRASKTLAEQAVWKFMKDHQNDVKFDISTINPSMVSDHLPLFSYNTKFNARYMVCVLLHWNIRSFLSYLASSACDPRSQEICWTERDFGPFCGPLDIEW